MLLSWQAPGAVQLIVVVVFVAGMQQRAWAVTSDLAQMWACFTDTCSPCTGNERVLCSRWRSSACVRVRFVNWG